MSSAAAFLSWFAALRLCFQRKVVGDCVDPRAYGLFCFVADTTLASLYPAEESNQWAVSET
jgi:hypothetical protein